MLWLWIILKSYSLENTVICNGSQGVLFIYLSVCVFGSSSRGQTRSKPVVSVVTTASIQLVWIIEITAKSDPQNTRGVC